MIYINPHSLTNVSFSTKIEKKNFSEFQTCPPRMSFLTTLQRSMVTAIADWPIDDRVNIGQFASGRWTFAIFQLDQNRRRQIIGGVRGEDRRSTACKFLWQSLLREWWQPLVVAATCCSKSGGSHCCVIFPAPKVVAATAAKLVPLDWF